MSIYTTMMGIKRKLFINNFKGKYPDITKYPNYPDESKEGFKRTIISKEDNNSYLLDQYSIKYMDSKLGITPELVYVNGKLVDLPYKHAIDKVLSDLDKSDKKEIKVDVVCVINDNLLSPPDIVIRCYIFK